MIQPQTIPAGETVRVNGPIYGFRNVNTPAGATAQINGGRAIDLGSFQAIPAALDAPFDHVIFTAPAGSSLKVQLAPDARDRDAMLVAAGSPAPTVGTDGRAEVVMHATSDGTVVALKADPLGRMEIAGAENGTSTSRCVSVDGQGRVLMLPYGVDSAGTKRELRVQASGRLEITGSDDGPVPVAGFDGTAVRTVRTDLVGRIDTIINSGNVAISNTPNVIPNPASSPTLLVTGDGTVIGDLRNVAGSYCALEIYSQSGAGGTLKLYWSRDGGLNWFHAEDITHAAGEANRHFERRIPHAVDGVKVVTGATDTATLFVGWREL